MPQAPGPQAPLVKASIISANGLVVDIKDKPARLVVKHQPIKAVGWLVSKIIAFPVADRSLLKKVKKGDNIHFDVRFEGQKYTIVDVEKLKK
jgi:Cu/Ag efflux protein CusF